MSSYEHPKCTNSCQTLGGRCRDRTVDTCDDIKYLRNIGRTQARAVPPPQIRWGPSPAVPASLHSCILSSYLNSRKTIALLNNQLPSYQSLMEGMAFDTGI